MAAQELLNWTSTTTSPNGDYSTQYMTSQNTTASVSLASPRHEDIPGTTWDHIVGGVIAYAVLVVGLTVLVVLQYVKNKPFTLMLKQEETDTYTVS